MVVRAVLFGFFALASACGFDTAGDRASSGTHDAATDGDASTPGTPDGSPPGTPDGAPDGVDAAGPILEVLVDEFTVPATGEKVESDATLDAGTTYRIVVSGVVVVSSSGGGWSSDADWFWKDSEPNSVFEGQTGDPPIDVGVAIDDGDVAAPKTPDWGNPRADHTYDTDWPGEDKTIEVQFHEGNYDNNAGEFTIEIYGPAL